MAIEVTVTEQCDRCKRKEQVTISSDKVAEFEARAESHMAQQAAVKDFVDAQNGKLPDLVVIFKGKVSMLSNVCDAFCTKTVANGLDILFREHKPRKPRAKKTPEEVAAAKEAPDTKNDKKSKGGKAA